MRGIWRHGMCRQCPIMRFDRCFVRSFLYFELYAISSIKLFRHQLYLYAQQSVPMRVCPTSPRYLHAFYTQSRFVISFLKDSHFTQVLHPMMRLLYSFTYSKMRMITLNNSIYVFSHNYLWDTLKSYLEILQNFYNSEYSNSFLENFIFSINYIIDATKMSDILFMLFLYTLYIDFMCYIFLYLAIWDF